MSALAPDGADSSYTAATEAIDAARREPFGLNAAGVGVQGRATQQRILTAALELFEERGYHQTSVQAITERAGCSRPTLYQYFESKDDLFRKLAGHFGARLSELLDNLDPIDASAHGVEVAEGWFGQLVDVHRQFRPIATSFAASLRRDEQMTAGARTLTAQYGTSLAGRLVDPLPTDMPLGRFAQVVSATGYEACNRAAQHPAMDRDRLVEGIAKWTHRAFFGRIEGVNAGPLRTPAKAAPTEDLPSLVADEQGLLSKGKRTRALLLQSGSTVLGELGYHNTRVDDIVAHASLSHGAFYRYFNDKEAIFTEVAVAAAADMIRLIDELPNCHDRLDDWARRYHESYEANGALFQIWPEASEAGVVASGPVVAQVNASLKRALAHRSYGDVEVDCLVLLALLGDPMLNLKQSGTLEDDGPQAIALVLERSLLG